MSDGGPGGPGTEHPFEDDEDFEPAPPVSPLRLIVGLLAIVGAVAFAIAVWVMRPTGSPAGTVLDLFALDDGGALVVRTTTSHEVTRLERLKPDGSLRWRAELPPFPWLDTGLPRLTVEGDLLTVRTDLADGTIVGLDLPTGDERWRMAPLEGERAEGDARRLVLRAGSLSEGGRLLEAYASHGEWAELVALDRRTGTVQWRAELHPEAEGPIYARGDRIVVVDEAETRILDAEDGTVVRAFVPAGEPCVLADRVVYSDEDGTVLVAPHAGGEKRRLPVDRLDPDAPGTNWQVRACGLREGRLVIALSTGEGADTRLQLVSLDTAPDTPVAWRLDLGASALPGERGFDVRSRHPDAYPLAGELPRNVPLVLQTAEGAVLILVDVSTGRLAWRVTLDVEMSRAQLLRVGQDTWIYDPGTRFAARFDGETGLLAAAARVGSRGYITTWPHHFAAGRLWTHYGVRVGPLDATTLEPVHPAAAPWVRTVDASTGRERLGLR